jgi:hypothetical protein
VILVGRILDQMGQPITDTFFLQCRQDGSMHSDSFTTDETGGFQGQPAGALPPS